MEAVGVITAIGIKVAQWILADAMIMAAQPPETNQAVLETTIKCDTIIMPTATASLLDTMTGIHNAMLHGHQGGTATTTCAARTTPGTRPRGLAQ